ncbi:hypothetical protein MHTCC0001_28980 [Flavobacteriaceae bacterium MHTCC 0001]
MKKLHFITLIATLTIVTAFAQQEKGIYGDENWLANWTEFQSNQEDYGEPTQILTGNITEDITLRKSQVYLLLGSVIVTDSVTLTIEPGTVILGDHKTKASLTISKGGKIMAEGLSTDPIIFTSNKSLKRPGDWGGIVVLGDAPINRHGSGSAASFYPSLAPSDYRYTSYGGENTDSSSGVMKYVRIEYAGKRISTDTYFNGLLLACIGSKTVMENIMISNTEEDAIEVWGGNTLLSNIVTYKVKGSDFIFNHGSQSILSNSLAVRSPYSSNGEESRCLQVLSFTDKREFDFTKPKTSIKVENVTFLNNSDDLSSAIKMNLVHEAIYIGENTELNMLKSIISGFNPAVIMDNNISINQENLEKMSFTEMMFNNCNGNLYVENTSNNDDLEDWYGSAAFYNLYTTGENSETFIAPTNYKRPDFRLRIDKIIASNNVKK